MPAGDQRHDAHSQLQFGLACRKPTLFHRTTPATAVIAAATSEHDPATASLPPLPGRCQDPTMRHRQLSALIHAFMKMSAALTRPSSLN
eukprot:6948881-Prymnesium_polylepis.1